MIVETGGGQGYVTCVSPKIVLVFYDPEAHSD
jgi:hypothetical protein